VGGDKVGIIQFQIKQRYKFVDKLSFVFHFPNMSRVGLVLYRQHILGRVYEWGGYFRAALHCQVLGVGSMVIDEALSGGRCGADHDYELLRQFSFKTTSLGPKVLPLDQ
jgi:hypothetical protein